MADVEAITAETLKSLGMWRIPVDPYLIAKEEGIELAPGEYGQGFDARIEFAPSAQRFILFFKSSGPGRTEGRVRFSLAHELGHYYLASHREYLLCGKTHNSVADFRSKDPREVEADEFAASLLMPRDLFAGELERQGLRYCTLKNLCKIADEGFKTSLTSTVRRYCQFDWEPCAMIVSRAGRVVWAFHSESMRAIGMSFVAGGSAVPATTPTAKLLSKLNSTPEAFFESEVDAGTWYERPFRNHLWEEVMPLGNTGLVLTFLAHDDSDRDE